MIYSLQTTALAKHKGGRPPLATVYLSKLLLHLEEMEHGVGIASLLDQDQGP
jgi:hypothetical protein